MLKGSLIPSNTVTPRRHAWGCSKLCTSPAKALNKVQRVSRQAVVASQGFGPPLQMEGSEQMRRLGEDAQEAFASGNPDTLGESEDELMEGMLKEMEVVRKEVLQKPEVLPILVKQLRLGDPDQQSKAAEMLFCVVGQGAGRDATATKQALDEGLLQAILSALQKVSGQPSSQIRQDQDTQQLLSLLVAMLAQITSEDGDEHIIQTLVSQGAVKYLRSIHDVMSGEGAQQNLVSLLWHWTTHSAGVRQQVMDAGIAELQVGLLGLQHSPVQRRIAADQLCAYVSIPDQQPGSDQQPARSSRLAEDLIHAGAPMALIELVGSRYHERVRCAAAKALATLATFSPAVKLKIIAAGACHPVVAMMGQSEPSAVRAMGALVLATLSAGDPGVGPVFTQTEAAVQFAGTGAVPALADMLRPINEPDTRIMAIQALKVMADAFDARIQTALVSAGVLPLLVDLLRVLSGRLDWDASLDDLEQPTIMGMRVTSAAILASIAVENPDYTKLLVDLGAVPELIVVASDTDIPEEEREYVMRMLHHMCQTDQDVFAILNAMMADNAIDVNV